MRVVAFAMTSLLHLSNLRFGKEVRPVTEALMRFAREHAPDLVVVSGNLTNGANAEQFGVAKTFVDRLAPARVVVPGMRDLPGFGPERMLAPHERFRRAFGHDLEPVFESPAMLVIAIDSTRRQLFEGGALSAAQIERCAQRLEHASEKQLRIVVLHHPLAAARPEDQPRLVRGHEAAVGAWAEAGADLVLCGQLPTPSVVALHRRYEQLPKTMWAAQAGVAAAARTIEQGHSFNFIRFEPPTSRRRSMTIERWDHVPERGRFHCVKSEELHVHDTIFSRSKAA
jgi:3',5'-cyclic AMP phosphodiesterase CpdA